MRGLPIFHKPNRYITLLNKMRCKDKEGFDMEKGKLIPIFLTALFAVVISIFSYSMITSSNSDPTLNKVKAETEENKKDGDSAITNNVENNVNSENADVNNSIENKLNNSDNNSIENNVTNNIEVNVDVNVTNNINNNVDGQNSGSKNNGEKSQGNGVSEQDGSAQGDNNDTSNDDEVVWGVDSASLTTSEMLACVRDNFGDPKIWGRYLGEKDGVSAGLTTEEVELLHTNDIQILVIWNHFNDATGYKNGQQEAELAIQKAEEFGIPEGVAIFADIEPNYPVDSEFIRGWSETMTNSKYSSGIYGVFDPERDLYKEYEKAASNNREIAENTYLWTAAPNIGITSESNAPQYQPEAPENTLIGGWQYGLDAQACNIDTNLFSGKITDVLW